MTVYLNLDKLEALKIPEIQKIFLEVMQNIVDRSMLNEMIQAIKTNDINRLFRATSFTPAALEPLVAAIEQMYKDGAETTVSSWPKKIITPSGPAIFRFDMRNPAVEYDLRSNSSAMITRLTDEARENVRMTLERGMIAGENPRTTALNIVGRYDPTSGKRIGGVIGLTNPQAAAVDNVERYLQARDPRYLKMKLRDKRFDHIFTAALRDDKPLKADTVSRMVTRYKDGALKYRADTIARTETVQSINRAEAAANKQIVDDGLVERDSVTKEWDDVGDKKVRTTHRQLARKYGKEKGIPMDEPFVTNGGDKLMFPGDNSLAAPAREIINCRCRVRYRIDWFAGVE